MNEQSPLDTLTRRLDRLEREVRWWRVLAGCCAVVLGLLGLWVVGKGASPVSAATPRVIEAEKFVLRDARGRSRAVLEVDGSVSGLTLKDEREVTRVSLKVFAEGPIVGLMAENEKPRVLLNALAAGWGLALVGEDEKPTASLGSLRNGGTQLSIGNDTSRATLGAAPKYGAALRLDDGNVEVSLLSKQESSGFWMRGKSEEKGSAHLTFNEASPVFYFSDKFQKGRLILGSVPRTTGNVWGFNVQDGNGKTLWAVP